MRYVIHFIFVLLLAIAFTPQESNLSCGVNDGSRDSFLWLPPEYEIVNLHDGVISFRNATNYKYGLMDTKGNIIIEPIHGFPLEFFDGLAVVQYNDKVCFMNLEGEIVIETAFDWSMPFSEELAAAGKTDDDGYVFWLDEFWFINTKGEVVHGPYDALGREAYLHHLAFMEYSEGLTAYFVHDVNAPLGFKSGYTGTGYWGFLDKEGNIAIPANFLYVRPFSDGLAEVQTADNRWIRIDNEGNEVMKLSKIPSFDNEMDIIKNVTEVNEENSSVAPIFDEIIKCCHGFFVVRKGDKWGIITP